MMNESKAEDFSESSFLIAKVSFSDYNSSQLWSFIQRNKWAGLEFDIDSLDNDAVLRNSKHTFSAVLDTIGELILADDSKIIPVFINYSGNVHLLDSIINNSAISSQIFYLPQGEKWPSTEYLVQSNRRIIFFVQGSTTNESRVLHHVQDYVLQIGARQITPNSVILSNASNINRELFKINNFNRLPTGEASDKLSRRMVPDYINFLLDSWTKLGKKPNFISVGNSIYNFDFIVDQLNSFHVIKGLVRTSGKNLERVYWKNSDILITGGKFSFPIFGSEELILTPFAPGYQMTPAQLISTNEMEMPENYSILATPLNLGEGIKASFNFEGSINDVVNPEQVFDGRNYSFIQDIDRGHVLRLPENANIVIGVPSLYGLPNSSFTVSCFVKFTDILEFGDNAILGNDEQGYRRGMHLVLRSGHPYFGLWANDFMSEEMLEANIWYHLVWRYIIETGEQAIFVNGKFVGGSDGHPAYSGTSNLHIGSALSRGASLRGYIDNLNIWNRPLGNEEITRLSSDEEIHFEELQKTENLLASNAKNIVAAAIGLLVLVLVLWIFIRRIRNKKEHNNQDQINLPAKNQIQLFGELRAINKDNVDVSDLFTPKVKELLVYTIFNTMRSGIGASISDVNETLWHGIDSKKVANNRAVTLNKLRKILVQFDQIEIISNGGYLQLKSSESFFCDYIEAFKLCQIPQGMSHQQLEMFFHLVKKGRLLKGIDWVWLDEIRGFTGNQVIDNLLKLASQYKKETKLKEVEKVAQRILDYDDLNEEAIYFQIWALQKANNSHLAKFNFNSFCSKYEKNMGEPFTMSFNEFIRFYAENL
jgi:two-component SAPR family response regulator